MKKYLWLSCAADVIGALRVKPVAVQTDQSLYFSFFWDSPVFLNCICKKGRL